MRLVFGLVLILGLGLAGFAVYTAKGYIGNYQAELQRERAAAKKIVPTKDVYVVTRVVEYGERLAQEDMKTIAWPENSIPEGAFTSEEDMFPEGPETLRTVLRTMEIGEPVMQVKVTEPGEDAGLTSRLKKGMRAFAIKVDVTSGVSGFLRPGDRVDVYWSGSLGGGNNVTKIIEAGIRIIAVDQTANKDRNGAIIARNVTVEATPKQVAGLAQAQATGRLSLSLVGAQDDTIADLAIEVDQKQLLGIEEAQRVIEEVEEVCTVRTRKGAEVIEMPIPCTN
ncbi:MULTISPECIES: Flp pilus assembly protein CpaB [Halocynthiibacter]|uniref:Flp pilus assembly protein CpaB n=1 Tax=Halocynthiibacter halioticoli TaxID=2986804 RepID=A0AAE3LUQ4_9RHOB|nr:MULTISPECIES: Flp pilus assembly protein CpaB [Halocynthiibacter]MCV6825270.1 Flp pilus assembly protein CpaB [Halocynthiibacter halioticoli]MCW4058271.1 Flp pilus assembly protein CpaB [Halocynthiibacter sp. SDUM655004]MDE0588708.1 Flp pilus assembly protein CpaB [Halocynthiibacter sp. C4]